MTTTALQAVPETALSAAPPNPQDLFAKGFEGAAAAPFPELARKILAEPVNDRDVEIKPDGIVFLPGVAWRRILTRAFGAGGWALLPRSPARYMKDQNLVVYHGALFCLGRYVAEAVGECFYRDNNPNMSYASCVEGAKTDCLGRCVKDLGYGAEMWDANWREKWKAQYATTWQGNDGKTKWKLKNRVSQAHDLMAGAGGTAPPTSGAGAPSAAAGSSARTTSTAPTPSPAPSSSSTASAVPAPAPSDPADTGEAAGAEALSAIRGLVKGLGWVPKHARNWLNAHFGVQKLEALTEKQAGNVYTLLSCHGKPLYETLLTQMREKGEAK